MTDMSRETVMTLAHLGGFVLTDELYNATMQHVLFQDSCNKEMFV